MTRTEHKYAWIRYLDLPLNRVLLLLLLNAIYLTIFIRKLFFSLKKNIREQRTSRGIRCLFCLLKISCITKKLKRFHKYHMSHDAFSPEFTLFQVGVIRGTPQHEGQVNLTSHTLLQ